MYPLQIFKFKNECKIPFRVSRRNLHQNIRSPQTLFLCSNQLFLFKLTTRLCTENDFYHCGHVLVSFGLFFHINYFDHGGKRQGGL